MKRVFTTSTVPHHQRADLWEDFLSSSLAAIEVSDFDPGQFEAHVDFTQLGEFDVMHYTGTEQSKG